MRGYKAIVVLLLTVLASAATALAATPALETAKPTKAQEEAAKYTSAAVMLEGDELFRVRGISAFPADERARDVSERIHAIAANTAIPIEALHIVDLPDRTNILAGNHFIISLVDADAALEGVQLPVLADITRRRIAMAIETYRHNHSPRVLLINTGYALGATLIFGLFVFGLRRSSKKLDEIIERRFQQRIEGLQAQSHQLIQAEQVRRLLRGLLRALYILVVLLTAYFYLNLVFALYSWTRPFEGKLLEMFLDPLRILGRGLIDVVPKLIFIAIVAIITRYRIRLMRLFFIGIERGTIVLERFESDLAWPTYQILRLLVIAFAVVVAYPHIPGSGSEAFKGVSILFGVLISLGSSSFIANVIAGYTVIYRRAFKVGDRIRINETMGDVTEIRLTVTHLHTVKNEEVTIPNSLIMASNVVNYSVLARTQGLILHTAVTIGYETPWRQVEAMLKLASERTAGLREAPPPFVLQTALGDFAVSYELNVYCDDAQAMQYIHTALHQNILDVFNEYGVQIMSPAYERDPAQPKVVPKEQWYAAPATPPSTSD